MRKIYRLLIITIIALFFSACDDTDGGSNASFTSAGSSIIGCSDTTNIPAGYTSLNSGDTIVKDTDGTQVSIFHDSNGNKYICVSSGSASIIQG